MILNKYIRKLFYLVLGVFLFLTFSGKIYTTEHLAPEESEFVTWHQQEDGSYRFNLKNRIIGGSAVSQGTYPWMVSLNDSGHFCGGSLIDANWVLTAAHCVVDRSSSNPQLNVVINRSALDSSEGEFIAVDEIFIHPDYVSVEYGNDIALLKLTTPSSQTPITLIAQNAGDLTGSLARVIGWGVISTTDLILPNDLQAADVPVVSNIICNSSYSNITNTMICAGLPEGGIDACQGDSGGPLVVFSNNSWTQIGIVSWGIGCAQANYYGVYARLTELTTWVNNTINNSSSPQVTIPASTPISLVSGHSISDSIDSASWIDYTILSSASDSKLTVNLTNLSDDADLYVRKTLLPYQDAYDCASYNFGSVDEYCELDISGQDASTWYVSVYGYATVNISYSLTATLFNEANNNSSREQIEQFVTRFYQQTLLRDPDSTGLDYWGDSLENGILTGADIAYSFIFSTEFLNRQVSDQEYVAILYRAFFNREPDEQGYNEWITHLSSGQSREFILNGFLGAVEFYNLCNEYNITCH